MTGSVSAQLRQLVERVQRLEEDRGSRDDAGDIPSGPAQLVRDMIRQRTIRDRHFDPSLFGEPSWDMILALGLAEHEGARVSVSALCLHARGPGTTALRHQGTLVQKGLIRRRPGRLDGRRVFVELTNAGAAAMARYLAELTAPTPSVSYRVVGRDLVIEARP